MTARDDLARCERCGGSGWDIDTVHRPYAEECPDCHGTCTQPAAAPPDSHQEHIDAINAFADAMLCDCGHCSADHYGEGEQPGERSCMGDAPSDPTGTVYCACKSFRRSHTPPADALDEDERDGTPAEAGQYEWFATEKGEVRADAAEEHYPLSVNEIVASHNSNVAQLREARKEVRALCDGIKIVTTERDELRREVERLHENRKECERDYTDLRDREDALRVSLTALLEAAEAARKQMKHGHERTRDKRGCLACKAIRTIDSAIARAKHGGK